MYILKVELYKNAVRIITYKNGIFVGYDILKIYWWQKEKAREIINTFYLNSVVEFYIKGVEWIYYENLAMKWNFKTHTIR